MKTKIIRMINQQRFREYAVLYRKHWWSRWMMFNHKSGNPGLFSKENAEKIKEWIDRGVLDV